MDRLKKEFFEDKEIHQASKQKVKGRQRFDFRRDSCFSKRKDWNAAVSRKIQIKLGAHLVNLLECF